ncbi:NUDIX hydrolase [Rhodococcus sp. PvR099]|uniref:NUDIX hydrolase n=1 Tax=Rhodococcus sp. PvR099 TaxID=2806602 RepID=UPI001AE2E46F|nr:NUDIX hydrolase [Rhodococcus sp. PvR099]MBP1159820.1 ADP-ribose pyrophosphatase YjhB (NUDIX family) [Rhodococcus sp. PvR099]
MSRNRDSSDRTLEDYPRPSVAVDVVVLTYSEGALRVVVVEHKRGMLALPGAFLHERELLTAAAERALLKADMTGTQFHQLALFDHPDRDERGWVLSMAHTAVVPADALPETAILVPVHDGAVEQELGFDHADMVRLAVDDLRARYAARVDPAGLLGESFTMLELRQLYEVVFARELQKDSFRRHVVGSLEKTGEWSKLGNGRPAELFRRNGDAGLPAQAAVLFTR